MVLELQALEQGRQQEQLEALQDQLAELALRCSHQVWPDQQLPLQEWRQLIRSGSRLSQMPHCWTGLLFPDHLIALREERFWRLRRTTQPAPSMALL